MSKGDPDTLKGFVHQGKTPVADVLMSALKAEGVLISSAQHNGSRTITSPSGKVRTISACMHEIEGRNAGVLREIASDLLPQP